MTEASLSVCRRLEKQINLKPYALVQGKEILSYPWPENGKIYVNARTVPGDPTTMKTFEVVGGKLVVA